MKYVIYLRVSKDEQDERTQEDYCLRFLKHNDRTEFNHVIFTDKITSRKSLDKRLGLQSALKSLDAGDVLIAMRVDRLARNLHEVTCIIHELDKKKADVVLVDQPGIRNKALLGLYAGMAEEEGKMLRKRVKEKLHTKRMRNERISGQLPYGYRMDEEKLIEVGKNDNRQLKQGVLVEHPEEILILRMMEDLHSEGNSFRQITQVVNERGHRNRNRKVFHHMSVYKILTRRDPKRFDSQDQDGSIVPWFR